MVMVKAVRFRPGSLLARTNLTLAVSSLLIAVIAIAALNVYVINPIAERSADDEAALLILSARTWVELPAVTRPAFELELAQTHDLIISAQVRDLPLATLDQPYLTLLQEKLSERLNTSIELMESDELYWVNVPMEDSADVPEEDRFDMQIGFSPERRNIQPLYVGIIIIGLGAGVVFMTSLFIVQRITRPLVQAAERVETFRGGENFDQLPEEGPRELVSLARSINTMASEISTLLANRTTLLAGVSHDLRTPLTRMRLALELLPDDVDPKLVQRFERNLESMDTLIGDALRFARGTGEAKQSVDVSAFVENFVESYDQSIPLTTNGTQSLRLDLAPGALQRVLTNLVSNAQQHGDLVRLVLNDGEIHVIDSGPGIPPESREEVFQPFFRLDRSRSVVTGGSGLGLAIVQQLCQAQGWRVRIDDGPDGGVDVVVTLT